MRKYLVIFSLFLVIQALSKDRLGSTDGVKDPELTSTNQRDDSFVRVNKHTFDAEIAEIEWCGDVKEGNIFIQTTNGVLYQSHDHGRTWTRLSLILADISRKPVDGSVYSISGSPSEPSTYIFKGKEGENWITRDCGENVKVLEGTEYFHSFMFHPELSNWILASNWTDCSDSTTPNCAKKNILYFSRDSGGSWEFLIDYVFEFDWAVIGFDSKKVPAERILVSRSLKPLGDQSTTALADAELLVSDDFFKTKKRIFNEGSKFLLTPSFLFVVKFMQDSLQTELFVSESQVMEYDFETVQMPFNELEEYSYTVLDTQENQVFINVNHLARGLEESGNLYISDSRGARYSLALKNCVRNGEGMVDFERVRGMEGAYLANKYDDNIMEVYRKSLEEEGGGSQDPWETQEASSSSKKTIENSIQNYKQTFITYDKGAKWQRLEPPTHKLQGGTYDCRNRGELDEMQTEPCFLNLHSMSSEEFGKIYTTDNSLGIILGTGNVGAHLSIKESEVNTYMSRDGGLHWYEIAKGSHIYEISDHGALIVIAINWKATDSVYFTWNEGKSWEELHVSDEEFEVENIMVEPNNIGSKFLVYGQTKEPVPKGVVVALDFGELHKRNCKGHLSPDTDESDYEIWTPHTYNSEKCLMGRRVQYIRRKRGAECFNGISFEEKVYEEPCECTDDDWECDLGYTRSGIGAPCLLQDPEYAAVNTPPANCKGTYLFGNGYRKVAGDSCINGISYGTIYSCPSSFYFIKYAIWASVIIGVFSFLWTKGKECIACLYEIFDYWIMQIVNSWFGSDEALLHSTKSRIIQQKQKLKKEDKDESKRLKKEDSGEEKMLLQTEEFLGGLSDDDEKETSKEEE